MKVIIVDDHAVVRMGLRAVLENAGGMSVAADFARAEDAINWLRAHPVDLVIMDLRFKQTGAMDGTSAVRAIKQMGGPPVLVVTTYGSEPEILGALAAGGSRLRPQRCRHWGTSTRGCCGRARRTVPWLRCGSADQTPWNAGAYGPGNGRASPCGARKDQCGRGKGPVSF